MTQPSLTDELDRQKRAVSYDVYDMTVRQLVDMVAGGEIDVAPDYQRRFVWDDERESELVESIYLGIPVPSLYMAANRDSSWEVVDGVQRLSTLVHFCGQAGEPFFRGELRSSQAGLGLGLHIASEIAKAHGGTLNVTSSDLETRFTFVMPLLAHPVV